MNVDEVKQVDPSLPVDTVVIFYIQPVASLLTCMLSIRHAMAIFKFLLYIFA